MAVRNIEPHRDTYGSRDPQRGPYGQAEEQLQFARGPRCVQALQRHAGERRIVGGDGHSACAPGQSLYHCQKALPGLHVGKPYVSPLSFDYAHPESEIDRSVHITQAPLPTRWQGATHRRLSCNRLSDERPALVCSLRRQRIEVNPDAVWSRCFQKLAEQVAGESQRRCLDREVAIQGGPLEPLKRGEIRIGDPPGRVACAVPRTDGGGNAFPGERVTDVQRIRSEVNPDAVWSRCFQKLAEQVAGESQRRCLDREVAIQGGPLEPLKRGEIRIGDPPGRVACAVPRTDGGGNAFPGERVTDVQRIGEFGFGYVRTSGALGDRTPGGPR